MEGQFSKLLRNLFPSLDEISKEEIRAALRQFDIDQFESDPNLLYQGTKDDFLYQGDIITEIQFVALLGKTQKGLYQYEKTIQIIGDASKLAIRTLGISLESWMKNDMEQANRNIESIPDLISACENINKIAIQLKGEESIAIGYIAESIRRTGEYSGDISELTINHLLNQ